MSAPDAAAPAPGPDLRIVGGDPTPEELAAVTAVLTAALDELAHASRRAAQTAPSAWEASRRALRTPLRHGVWRGLPG